MLLFVTIQRFETQVTYLTNEEGAQKAKEAWRRQKDMEFLNFYSTKDLTLTEEVFVKYKETDILRIRPEVPAA